MKIKIGIEILRSQNFRLLKNRRVALLANPASLDHSLTNTIDIFQEASGKEIFKFVKIFGPQQGIFETQQANMKEWEGEVKSRFGIPTFSLYGENRRPTDEMLQGIDAFVVDLQDVGAKGYTFISTLFYVMEACEKLKIELVVLDRPNPLGGKIEGPVTDNEYKSFVGIHNLPLRHGLTIAELALLFQTEAFPKLNLEILKMSGWKRSYLFENIQRVWIPTTPNIPIFDTTLVYPGMELLEGTNISEGRGTTRPFEQCGAPFIDPMEMSERLNNKKIEGVIFRPVSFTPSFDKWKEKTCYGVFIHIKDPKNFSSVRCALEIIHSVLELYPDKFCFRPPPYEYEFEKLPFDVLVGNDYVRKGLMDKKKVKDIAKMWHKENVSFVKRTKQILLYK